MEAVAFYTAYFCLQSVQSGDTAAAKQYFHALLEKHGLESRWTIFENKYKAIFDIYGVELEEKKDLQ